jgi:hypothetical protein
LVSSDLVMALGEAAAIARQPGHGSPGVYQI